MKKPYTKQQIKRVLSKEYDLIVVGAGLVGSFVKTYFKSKGWSVLLLDSNHPMAGSKCSLGIYKEGWIGGFKEEAEQSIQILEQFIKIKSIEYNNLDIDDFPKESMSWVDREDILIHKFVETEVLKIENKAVFFNSPFDDGKVIEKSAKKAVLVAGGSFTVDILTISGYTNVPMMDIYWGGNIDLDIKVDGNRYLTWAPYKQSVLMKMNGSFRFSDGTMVKNPKGHDDERLYKVTQRMKQHAADILYISNLEQSHIVRINEGYRPYLVDSKLPQVFQHDKNLFSATGGRKNTSVLCGYIADQVFKQLQSL